MQVLARCCNNDSCTLDQTASTPGVEWVEMWLSRTATKPLWIRYKGEVNEDRYESLKALMRQSSRWNLVNLRLPVESINVIAPVQGHVSILESLTLSATICSPWKGYVDAFVFAPRLREVTLHFPTSLHEQDYGPFSVPISAFLLPWQQLTLFRVLTRISFDDGLYVLRLCPNLLE
jgi:hypothetical protein